MQNSKSFIHKYIRDKNNQPVGVVVAKKLDDSNVGIGWSKVNVSHGDRFNREHGAKIALNRAESSHCARVPLSIVASVEDMADRAARYFKGVKTIHMPKLPGRRIDYFSRPAL